MDGLHYNDWTVRPYADYNIQLNPILFKYLPRQASPEACVNNNLEQCEVVEYHPPA